MLVLDSSYSLEAIEHTFIRLQMLKTYMKELLFSYINEHNYQNTILLILKMPLN